MQVDGEVYQQALGHQLRQLRKRRGWTRKQLNQQLHADISLQTLATYELGTRQCSVVRLAEICLALGEQPHEVLARVDRSVFAGSPGEVQIDLVKVVDSAEPELLPLRRWAAGRLEHALPSGTEVSLNLAAVEWMAELCGLQPAELLDRLRTLSAERNGNGHPNDN
ncbi:MAG: helix-turn-helix domain-containing protein [Thermocrispum sp.]